MKSLIFFLSVMGLEFGFVILPKFMGSFYASITSHLIEFLVATLRGIIFLKLMPGVISGLGS